MLAGAEIARERRKCDIDHRTLNEGDARAEDRGGECRARVPVAAWENGRRDPGVAGSGDRPGSCRRCSHTRQRALLLPAHPVADPVDIDTELTQDEGRDIQPRRHTAIDNRHDPDRLETFSLIPVMDHRDPFQVREQSAHGRSQVTRDLENRRG